MATLWNFTKCLGCMFLIVIMCSMITTVISNLITNLYEDRKRRIVMKIASKNMIDMIKKGTK